MAEIRIVGSDGQATVTGHVAKFNAWSATISQPVTDTSAFGDSWSRARGGMKTGRGSASGTPSYNTASTAPNADTIEATGSAVTLLYASEGTNKCQISGTAIISDVNMNAQNAAGAGIAFNFQFDDTVTETWDETTS